MEFQWNNRYQIAKDDQRRGGKKLERDKTTYIYLIDPCISFDDRCIPLSQ